MPKAPVAARKAKTSRSTRAAAAGGQATLVRAKSSQSNSKAAASETRASKSSTANPTASATPQEKPVAKRPETFEDVIGELTGPVREIARQLRQLVFDVLPGVTERAYGGSKVQLVLYSLGGPTKTVCGIQPSGQCCLLYVHHVTPDDSQTLLIQGEGRHSQHVKVEAMTNLVVRDLKRLLSLARKRSRSASQSND